MSRRFTSVLIGGVLPALLALLWEFAARRGGAASYAFTPIGQIADSFVTMLQNGMLLGDLWASLRRTLLALLIGGGSGLLLGTALGIFRPLSIGVSPLINIFRQVPILGWLPLIALWLGNGDGARLLLVSLAAFYPTVLNTQKGFDAADRKLIEAGMLYQFSRWQRVRFIALPSALPLIFTGISQALSFAWIATIGVELLFSASAGLGTEMVNAQVSARTDIIMICILCVGVMGFLLNHGLMLTRNHLLRWHRSALGEG